MHGMHEQFSCSLSSFHKDLFLKYLPPSIWAADLPPDRALPDLNLGWLLGWKSMASLNQTTDFQGSAPPTNKHISYIYISNVAVFFWGGLSFQPASKQRQEQKTAEAKVFGMQS